MNVTFGIKKITVLTGLSGTDKVSIHTDLPSPFPPGVGNDYLIMDFEVQKGNGINYAKEHFPYPFILEHINYKTGEHKIR